jgi:integrase
LTVSLSYGSFSLYKGAIGEAEQPRIDIRLPQIDNRSALEYWRDELVKKAEGTRYNYLRYFKEFLTFVNMTADQVLEQRINDVADPNKKIQRRFESLFKAFLTEQQKKNYAPLTLQTIYASVRSFFEAHYYPLIMRKRDYPKGDSNGAKRASKEQIFKALNFSASKKLTTTALILTLKDSALRISDLRLLKSDIILDNPNADVIPIQRITQKTKLLAKTFIGEEAITALKAYLDKRRKGSRKVKPEKITRASPLFRTWTAGKVKPMSRTNISTLVRNAFLRVGIKKISAHSLRRYFQTTMEEANINVNWIDQMMGHELINCRGAYSKPTDEQLETAYRKAYDNLRIYPRIEPIHKETPPQTQVTNAGQEENLDVAEARTMEEVKQLLSKGYKYEMEMNGIKLFTKK